MQQNIDDYGTTWYCGKNPQEKAFSEGEKLGHKFYCHIDVSNGTIQSKAFGSYKDIRTFWKETRDIVPEEKAIYEIIRDSGPSKFYADLEWSLDWKSKTEILDDFSKIMKECFNQCFQYIFDLETSMKNEDDDVDDSLYKGRKGAKILDACNVGKNKGSLHITHPDIYFDNLSCQRRFWSHVKTTMENDYPKLFFQDETECNFITKTFIDFSVYTKNRAFRLPFSSKMKNHILERPLIPDEKITINNIGDYIISNPPFEGLIFVDVSLLPINTDSLGKKNMVSKKILNNLADKYKVKIGKIKGNLIQLKNVGNRICPINGECNESDNAYFKIKNGFVEYKCFDENCKNKTLCIHKIDDSENLRDNIPFDDYNRVLQDALDQIKRLADLKPIAIDRLKICMKNYYTVLTQLLQDINKYICVITGSSKPYFLIRKVGVDELENKYIYYVRQLKTSLQDTFQNRFYTDNFTLGPKDTLIPGKQKSWIDLWLKWDKRQQYDSEVFQSPCTLDNLSLFNTFHHLNITKNLAIERADLKGEQSVAKFLNFIKVAWANGNEEIYDWVINWFAHNVQKPLVKMSSALVLRGEEGVGKGMVIQKIKQILGNINFCQPTTPNDILGNFNSIVDRKAFLFLDELVWGGDKEKAGILKKIITEVDGTINEKGIPQRKFQNCYNVAIATNEDWAIPAGNNARRFMMLDVINTEEKKDINKSDVYDCCPYSLAKFLYDRDISKFRHDKIIVTNALASQKELSASNPIKFILEDIKNDTFPFDQKIEAVVLYERFKSTYPHAKYTTVQSFCKQINKVINYTIYKPFKCKRLLCIPSKDDCLLTINKFFKQDMFIDDLVETESGPENVSNVYEVETPCIINPLL